MSDIVRAIVEFVGSMAPTLAQHQGVGEGSGSRSNVDGSATGIIQTSEVVYPT
jgi:hypothetical protein